MPAPHSATYPSAPSASSASAGSNTGSYPGLAEYMGLELTEAEVRANMPEYLPAVVQVLNICEAIFCLTLAPNRAAALPLCLELALLHPYLAWLLAWPKHRWGSNSCEKRSEDDLESDQIKLFLFVETMTCEQAVFRWPTGWGKLFSARMVTARLASGWRQSTKVLILNFCSSFGFSWTREHFCCAGVFVCLVTKGSPAALGGLRFGDQILQVDGVNLAGFSSDKVRAHFFLVLCSTSPGAWLTEKGGSEQHHNGRQGSTLWEDSHSPQGISALLLGCPPLTLLSKE